MLGAERRPREDHLERGFRADETVIDVVVKDRYDIELTVAEAADLIGALAGCIQQLAGQQ